MSDLRLKLDDTDFAALSELGRSLIPTLAPSWTDHNVHDPGIMLIELLAWLADAQIYSIGRTRRDERRAYARLLGVVAQYPTPARGLLWPSPTLATGFAGTLLEAGRLVTSHDVHAPDFRLARSIELSGARLQAVLTRFGDGSPASDWTLANSQRGTTFQPFGPRPQPGDSLMLQLQGRLLAAEGLLSIGVEVVSEQPSSYVAAAGTPKRLRVTLESSDSLPERELPIIEDSTRGFLQSGVLLLRVPREWQPWHSQYSLSIRSTAELLRTPRVRSIALNVLPIVQYDTAVDELTHFGLGRPDQTHQLRQAGLVPNETSLPVQVQVEIGVSDELEAWSRVDDLTQAGPHDHVYALDPETQTLCFGNGVNGFAVPVAATLRASYRVSAGVRGNLSKPVVWNVSGIDGAFGTNTEPTRGGSDAGNLDDQRALARASVRSSRPIVTSQDLSAAALALHDLGVARAIELTPDSIAPAAVGTRTLVVVGRDQSESLSWLEVIRARLAVRLPLGQYLTVLGPRYVPVRVRARLLAAPSVDPEQLKQRLAQTLAGRFAVLAVPGVEVWRIGRSIHSIAVKGFLRKVPGVLAVPELELRAHGRVAGSELKLGRLGLPQLEVSAADFTIERAKRGSER